MKKNWIVFFGSIAFFIVGGVSLVQAIFVFIMWVGYNATRG